MSGGLCGPAWRGRVGVVRCGWLHTKERMLERKGAVCVSVPHVHATSPMGHDEQVNILDEMYGPHWYSVVRWGRLLGLWYCGEWNWESVLL